ncbi:MAG: FIST N-terminal domain-containing protein [Rhodocyclaceae bacterium]|nr:FIST N-terminal domain-containing protein [Rhodocyclaceae bacterium]
MEVRQLTLTSDFSVSSLAEPAALRPDLVLVFGSVDHFAHPDFFPSLKAAFPDALLAGCSTAGEISDQGVSEGSVVVTAVRFRHPALRLAAASFSGMDDSLAAGQRLARQLAGDEGGEPLRHILVFGQGVNINGSALIEGLAATAGAGVVISGGLAGDGGTFRQTWVLTGQGVSDQQVVAIGFYGEGVRVGYGSFGGWQPFGPARKVTRAEGNLLFELDGEPALDIYKRYLGEYANGLPASGLLFPLSMLGEDHREVGLIRTILGVDEAKKSLILAGDVVEHGYMQLMHASTDALVDGAIAAAETARERMANASPGLTLLVSCVGRKLVMGARVDEEVEAVAEVFGNAGAVTGFYSYGEISPFLTTIECRLHNQTMTITSLSEPD